MKIRKQPVCAIIKNGRPSLVNVKTNLRLRPFGEDDAILAITTKTTAIVLYANGKAYSYDRWTGVRRGQFRIRDIQNIDAHNDIVLISYANGRRRRFNARSRQQITGKRSLSDTEAKLELFYEICCTMPQWDGPIFSSS